jgi:hypothetical protein
MNKRKILIGEKFGNLTVLRRGPKTDLQRADGGNTTWVCRCACENQITIRTFQLPKQTSCGCLPKNKPLLQGDEASFRNLFYEYKYASKQRGLLFSLTTEEFRKMTSSDCLYCGAKPNKLARATKGTRIHYIYNGIDRFDNRLGYVSENCVPCCSTCNHMKCQMTVTEFLQHAKRISSHTAVFNSSQLCPELN